METLEKEMLETIPMIRQEEIEFSLSAVNIALKRFDAIKSSVKLDEKLEKLHSDMTKVLIERRANLKSERQLVEVILTITSSIAKKED